MPGSHGYVFGIYSGSQKAEVLYLLDGEPLSISARYRGNYPSCGDGPWFCAVKQPDSVQTDKGDFIVGLKSGKVSQTYYANLSSINGRYVMAQGNLRNGKYYVHAGWEGYCSGITYGPNGEWYLTLYRRQKTEGAQSKQIPVSSSQGSDWVAAAQELCSRASWNTSKITVRDRYGRWGSSVRNVTGAQVPQFVFKNNELDTFWWASDFGILANGSASRFARAYEQAIAGLDLSQVNSLANIKDAASALVGITKVVRDIFRGDLSKVINDLKASADPRGLWLSYRYVYRTTKSDVHEYAETLQRLGDLASAGGYLSANGLFSDDTGSYGVRVKVKTDDVIPKDIVTFLASVGIEPNAQNFWDMVPYSFIVDWFVPIGGFLEEVDSWGNAISFPVVSCWFTYKSAYSNQTVSYRVPGSRPDIPPIYVEHRTATKTIVMRIADTIALFL